MMQLKLFAIDLPIVVIVVSLIPFNQLFTTTVAAAAADQTDIELADKDIKQKPLSNDKEDNDNNIWKQREEKQEEEEKVGNDNTRERGLEEDNIMIDDDDHEDVSFELPFDNIIPFPQTLHY